MRYSQTSDILNNLSFYPENSLNKVILEVFRLNMIKIMMIFEKVSLFIVKIFLNQCV